MQIYLCPRPVSKNRSSLFETRNRKEGSRTFVEPKITYKRNDSHHNTKNYLQLLYARANVDFSITENSRKTLAYETKYITKAQLSSQCCKEVLLQTVDNDNTTGKVVISKLMNMFVGQRDLSSHVVCHLLMYSSTES